MKAKLLQIKEEYLKVSGTIIRKGYFIYEEDADALMLRAYEAGKKEERERINKILSDFQAKYEKQFEEYEGTHFGREGADKLDLIRILKNTIEGKSVFNPKENQ